MSSLNNNNNINIEDLLSLAECQICNELKQDHRTLISCGHSFCLDDLEVLAKTSPKCPMCRTPFIVPNGGMKSLVKDFHKIALVELALKWQEANTQSKSSDKDKCFECGKDASLWCQEEECGYCDEHAELAHRIGKAKTHTLVLPSKKILKVYCSSHKKELEKYCTTCNKVICMDCFVFEHVGHKIGTVDAVADQSKKDLLNQWNNIQQTLKKQFTDEQQAVKQTSESHKKNLEEVKQKTLSYFEELIAYVLKLKDEMIDTLEEKDTLQQQLAARQKKLESSISELDMQTQALTSMSQKLNGTQWLAMESKIREDFSKWTYEPADLQEETLDADLPNFKQILSKAKINTKKFKQRANSPGTQTISLILPDVASWPLSGQIRLGFKVIPKKSFRVLAVCLELDKSNGKETVSISNIRPGEYAENWIATRVKLHHLENRWYSAPVEAQFTPGEEYRITCQIDESTTRFQKSRQPRNTEWFDATPIQSILDISTDNNLHMMLKIVPS